MDLSREIFSLEIESSFLENLNVKVLGWIKRVNSSVHRTTHEISLEHFKKENLASLDQVPAYRVVEKETRKVSRDRYVSYLGNKYSVFRSLQEEPQKFIFLSKHVTPTALKIFSHFQHYLF